MEIVPELRTAPIPEAQRPYTSQAMMAVESLRLLQAGNRAAALSVAFDALAAPSIPPATLDLLGTILSACGEHETALKSFRRSVALDSGNAQRLLNLSMELRFAGALEESEHYADLAIEIDPNDCEAHLHRAGLRTQTRERCHVSLLESLLRARIPNWRSEFQLRYALAKEYEDLGEHTLSFRHLKIGADLRRQHMRYDVATDVAIMEEIESAFCASWFGGDAPGFDDLRPIFVIGLPRTGTTLVERILTSHTDVTSAGELQEFGAEVSSMVRELTRNRKLSRTEFVQAAANIDVAELGRRYIERTRYIAGSKARFVDKLPGNFLYCGLIRRALPRATIVHLTRHPMAAAYSIYKTPFKHAYPFSYDLVDLAHYYVSYRRLMEHWNRVLPQVILTVRYEDLIADQAAQSRRVLAHCGLAWQDSVMNFQQNSAACTTASAIQVRRGIYATSVQEWKYFASELEPFRSAVERGGIALR